MWKEFLYQQTSQRHNSLVIIYKKILINMNNLLNTCICVFLKAHFIFPESRCLLMSVLHYHTKAKRSNVVKFQILTEIASLGSQILSCDRWVGLNLNANIIKQMFYISSKALQWISSSKIVAKMRAPCSYCPTTNPSQYPSCYYMSQGSKALSTFSLSFSYKTDGSSKQ